MDHLKQAVRKLEELSELLSPFEGYLSRAVSAFSGFNTTVSILNSTTAAFDAQVTSIGNQEAAIERSTAAINKTEAALTSNRKVTKQMKRDGETWNSVLKKQNIALKKKNKTLKVTKFMKGALNIVKMASPIMMIVAGITAAISAFRALVSVGSRIIGFFTGANRAAREHAEAVEGLSNRYGVSTEQIEEDLERMGSSSASSWETLQHAAMEGAETFQGCADQMREDILALMDYYEDYNDAIASWRDTQMQAVEDVAGEWGLGADEVIAHMAEMGMNAEEWAAHMSQAWEDFQGEVQSNVGGIINGFRKIPTEYQKSSEELREIMAANIATTADWQNNMTELAGRVSPEMLAQLEAKGPEFNSVIQEMLDCEDELNSWIELFDDATAVGTQAALDNIEDDTVRNGITNMLEETGQAIGLSTDVLEGYQQMASELTERMLQEAEEGGDAIGSAYVENTAEGISTGGAEVVSAFEETMNEVEVAATNSLTGLGEAMTAGMKVVLAIVEAGLSQMKDEFSNAKEPIKTSGVQALEQFGISVETGLNETKATATTGLTEITQVFDQLKSGMQTSGQGAMLGFRNGILAKKPTIIAAVSTVTEAVARTLKRVLKMNSPSRVMRDLGGYTMDGYAIGMEDKQKDVENVAKSTADTVTDELDKASKVQNKLQSITSKLADTKNKYADQAASMMKAGLDSAKAMAQNMDKMLFDNKLDQKLALAVSPPDAEYQTSLMEKLINTVASGQTIVMDSGELVGATYNGYDAAAGEAISYNSRWGR